MLFKIAFHINYIFLFRKYKKKTEIPLQRFLCFSKAPSIFNATIQHDIRRAQQRNKLVHDRYTLIDLPSQKTRCALKAYDHH